jgi:hypothetical protein
METYYADDGVYARLARYTKEPEYEYGSVLILDNTTAVEQNGKVYPTKSLDNLYRCSLCFYVMPNGGLKCIKDRYNFYGRDNTFFGL